MLLGPGLGAVGRWAMCAAVISPRMLNLRGRGGWRGCEAVSPNPLVSIPPERRDVLHPSQNSPLYREHRWGGNYHTPTTLMPPLPPPLHSYPHC